MPVEIGKLLVKEKKGTLSFQVQRENQKLPSSPREGDVSASIREKGLALHGQPVEFDVDGGQPKRLREVGQPFVAPAGAAPAARLGSREQGSKGGPGRWDQQARGGNAPTRDKLTPDFHNPYNFIPAPERRLTGELGDRKPPAQDRFEPRLYTGRMRVHLRVETPLLLPDTENPQRRPDKHVCYPVLRGTDDQPLILPSGIRGMLSAAYEAVTNSRLRRFSEHKRLAFRGEARESLKLVPARVQGDRVLLLPGTSTRTPDGPKEKLQYAAWLPQYARSPRAPLYSDGTAPAHGDEVECWLELFNHDAPTFLLWRVARVVRAGEKLGPKPARSEGTHKYNPTGDFQRCRGWVCITGRNMERKHDERVFFYPLSDDGKHIAPIESVALGEAHRDAWAALIENYQALHKEDPDRRQGDRGELDWSRHIRRDGAIPKADIKLAEGTLCYARLDKAGDVGESIAALFPVMISRELYAYSPRKLLPESLRPAEALSELSPADRVFGWVADQRQKASPEKAKIATRGLLRVGPVVCESANAIEDFGDAGLPLSILAAPKPQQGRFYVAPSKTGDAAPHGLTKQAAGYTRAAQAPRGRKVYPHQRLPREHWDNPMTDRTQSEPLGGHYQEYRRPQKARQEQRDSQNRSVQGWVKPDTRFVFELQVHNLTGVELGALLWLLQLPDGHFFRLGTGKPLGMGSVRLQLDPGTYEVVQGHELLQRYSAWHTTEPRTDSIEQLQQDFKRALVEAYAQPAGKAAAFEEIPFIKAFRIACCGLRGDLPTHYPRATANGKPGRPDPDGKSFEWFVANDRVEGGRVLHGYALPELNSERGLPTLPGDAPKTAPGPPRGRPPGDGPGRRF